MTSHVSIYMHKMAAAGVPMTSDQFAPRTRSEVTSNLKKPVLRGHVSKVRNGEFAHYSVSAEQLADYLKMHAKASKPQPEQRSSIRTELLEMAERPSGVSSDELLGRVKKAVGTVASLLTNAGLLHAWIGSKHNRWFSTAEARNAYAATAPKSAPLMPSRTLASPRPPSVVIKAKGWDKSAEPYFPTDEKGRPLYKVTIAPPFPQPTKTNTHSGAY